MDLLNKEAILGAADLATEDVAVPEWGGAVRVRTLTVADRDALFASCRDEAGKFDASRFNGALLAKSVVDANGNLVFSDADVDALNRKSAPAVTRVVEVAGRLNRLGDQAEEAATKNS